MWSLGVLNVVAMVSFFKTYIVLVTNKWKIMEDCKNSEDLLAFSLLFPFGGICQFNMCFIHLLFMSSISEEKALGLANMYFVKCT